jgi:hypothetical protein
MHWQSTPIGAGILAQNQTVTRRITAVNQAIMDHEWRFHQMVEILETVFKPSDVGKR